MTPRERWFMSTMPFVRAHLPSPPTRVIEIGCGDLREVVDRGEIRTALDVRFEPSLVSAGPYSCTELDGVSEADERDAVDAGLIRANGVRSVGRLRPEA